MDFSRDDVDAYSVESHKRSAKSWEEGRFASSVVPVRDILGIPLLDRDETIRPDTSMQTLGALKPSFADMGKNYGFDGVALQKYPEIERIDHVHTPGNSSGIVDGAAAVLIGTKEAGEKAGLKPRARIRSFRLHRLGADHHADRPELCRRARACQGRHVEEPTSTFGS